MFDINSDNMAKLICPKCSGMGYYYNSGKFNSLVCGDPSCEPCKGKGYTFMNKDDIIINE